MQAKEKLLRVVERIVEERKISMEKSDGNGGINDTLDVLLNDMDEQNDRRRFSSDFICGNIIEMMIPGEETVPTAMTLAVKFLTDFPEALKELKVKGCFWVCLKLVAINALLQHVLFLSFKLFSVVQVVFMSRNS